MVVVLNGPMVNTSKCMHGMNQTEAEYPRHMYEMANNINNSKYILKIQDKVRGPKQQIWAKMAQ